MTTFWSIAAGMMLVAVGCVTVPLLSAQRRHAALAGLLIAAVPSAAITLYMRIGNPAALALDSATSGEHADSPASLELMVSRLAVRLRREPNDAAGWAMLARSYAVLERPDDAAAAYHRALLQNPRDADLLADYADALASTKNGDLSGAPQANIDAALAIDPDHPKALALAASAAADRRDYAAAIRYWTRLRDVSGGETELARQAQKNIDELSASKR